MRKTVLPYRPEEDTPTTGLSANPGSHVRTDRTLATGTPRWVKGFVILFIILVLMFVIMHLSGNGFGNHMIMSTTQHRVQQLWL